MAVDFSIFYDEQKVAVDLIIDYIDGKTPHRMVTLRGYAGTGKSFVIGRLQDYLLYARKMKIAVSTPTNKAVQVVKDMCEISDANLTFSTIHKLLGLKETYDYNGRLKFIPDPQNPPSLSAYDILFLDEASMLDDDLFYLINPFIEEGVKIIFVGDPAQIPPINRMDCVPFVRKKQLLHNIGVCDLIHIRRQATDHPLLDFATCIREQRKNSEFDYEYKTILKEGMGIIPIAKDARDAIYRICDIYFANDIFAAYPDFMKVIAWRNVTVDAVNQKVRQLIYKQEELPLLMPGEKLIADQPIKTQEQATLTTNSEFEVLDYTVADTFYQGKVNEDVLVRERFKYYNVTVRALTDRGLRNYRIWTIHEDSLSDYENAIETIMKYAQRQSGYDRVDAWRAYYQLFNFFAKVKYNYAITAHKSQGSTYENTMMLEWDMYKNFKPEERNRIRYVSATRARSKLFVIK